MGALIDFRQAREDREFQRFLETLRASLGREGCERLATDLANFKERRERRGKHG